jgi:Helicase HerA, central domain/Type IV secretion-system coupling protein DNA-binding domain
MSGTLQRAKELLVTARREREARYAPLRRRAAPSVSAPATMPQPSVPAITMRRGKSVVLGRDGNGIAFTLDETSRREHMVVSGTTGGGKSTLFTNMARQDIENGHGVLFLDPHGSHRDSGYRRLLTWLGESGIAKTRPVHVIDPNAGTHCTGFNPLALPKGHHPTVIAEAALEAFERLWGDENPDSKPTIQRLLPAVFGALAERGLTLAEAMAVLDPDDGDGLRELLADEVEDEYAQRELQWLEGLGAEKGGRHDLRIEVTGPRNRIAKLIRAPAIRTMVGQTECVIDLRQAMDEGHIILANLSGGNLVYEKGADLLGRLLVRFLLFHAKRRQRPDRLFPVYLDEAQRYLSGDVPVALAELRKQGCAMVLGHQWQSQLERVDEEILSAVRNATNIKVSFRVKDHKEATDLAEMLIPLDLEKPIAALTKETVIGHERGILRNGGTTTSTGTNQATAHSVTDSVAETRSEETASGVANSVTDSVGKSRSTTVGESEAETETVGWSQTDSTSETQSENDSSSAGHQYGYDSPFSAGLPDSYNYSTGSASGSGSATTSGFSTTASGSTSTTRGRFTAETVGESQTHSVGRSESVVESEGVARSKGRAIGETTTTGSSSGLAHSHGYSEALIPIMALRPGGVHSKENMLYQAAQMLRSLPTGQCVISYVGPSGLETAMLKIPYRPVVPLSDEAFAKLRTAVFQASPSALPMEEAETHLKERRRRLLATAATIEAEPETFRVPVSSRKA